MSYVIPELKHLGRDHELDNLKLAWKKVSTGDFEPQLVQIVGEIGVGKTRLVREFYEWLRAESKEEFWPKWQHSASRYAQAPNAMENLEEIPQFDWFWMSVKHYDSGSAGFADFIYSLQPFTISLAFNKLVKEHRGEALTKIKGAGLKIGEAVILELFEKWTLIGKIKSLLELAVESCKDLNQARQEISSAQIVEKLKEKLLSQQSEAIANVAGIFYEVLDSSNAEVRTLPIILHLDDVQWMDEKSLELFQLLFSKLQNGFPLLVIATTRPTPANISGSEGKFWRGAKEAFPSEHRKTTIELKALNEREDWPSLNSHLQETFPGISSDDRREIIRQAGGLPLHYLEILNLMATMGNYFHARDFKQPLTPQGKASLLAATVSVELTLKARFGAVNPNAVKDYLALASQCGPKFSQEIVNSAYALAYEDPDATKHLGVAEKDFSLITLRNDIAWFDFPQFQAEAEEWFNHSSNPEDLRKTLKAVSLDFIAKEVANSGKP